ncbi:MAG: group III truncated hemoglobin [Rhodothermales bacterium]
MPDITTTDDVRTIVHAFYHDMETDPVIGHYFEGLDWPNHLPTMVRFWSSIVFATGQYDGRPFDPHARMSGLTQVHFAHWIARFHRTIDGLFKGERADMMKARAEQIAGVFQVKLGLWGVNG